MRAMSLLVLLLVWAGTSLGQGTAILFYEVDEILRDNCLGGNPLPDGTLIEVMWDSNSNGPDLSDSRYPVGANWGEANFNVFSMNGESILGQPGQFFVEVAFVTVGGILDPPLIYLRICLPDIRWESSVHMMSPGPHEFDPTWTCQVENCEEAPHVASPTNVRVWPTATHDLITWEHSGIDVTGFALYRQGEQFDTAPSNARIYRRERLGIPQFDYCVAAFNAGGFSDTSCADHLSYFARFTPESRDAWQDWVDPWEHQSVELVYEGDTNTAVALYLEHDGILADTLAEDTGAVVLYFDFPLECWFQCRLLLKARSLTYGEVQWDTTTGFFYTIFDYVPEQPDYVPYAFGINSAYPNPFNGETTIAFELRTDGRARLGLYDVQGRVIRTLYDQESFAGHNTVRMNAADLPTGVYFVRLQAAGQTAVRKLLLLK